MEEHRERIKELMDRHGYEEEEAEIAYHLSEARSRLVKMYRDEAEEEAEAEPGGFPRLWAQVFLMSNVNPHFDALIYLLTKRVLRRNSSEGGGSRPAAPEGEVRPE